MVRSAVFPHQAGPVEAKDHRQVLQGDIVYDIIVRALRETGVDVAEGFHAGGGEAGGKGDGMAFFDAHVKEAVREGGLQAVHAAAGGHGGGDTHHVRVPAGQVCKDLPEDILVAVGGIHRLDALAGGGVEAAGSMPGGRIGLRRGIAAAFAGVNMQQTRPVQVLQAFQCIGQLAQIVPVNGPEITETQRLEQGAAASPHQVGLGVDDLFLHPVTRFSLPEGVPDGVLEFVVERVRGYLQQVVVQAANVFVDGNVVVVQDNQDIRLGGACVVQAFPGQATGEGAVANDGDGLIPAAGEACGLCKAQRGRKPSRVRFFRKSSRRPVRILWA